MEPYWVQSLEHALMHPLRGDKVTAHSRRVMTDVVWKCVWELGRGVSPRGGVQLVHLGAVRAPRLGWVGEVLCTLSSTSCGRVAGT